MKEAPTALRSIGGFGIAVACLSVAATAALVVFAPEPAQPSMTVAQAVAALKGEQNGFERRIGPLPDAPRSGMALMESIVADIIARELKKPIDAVHVTWADMYQENSPGSSFRFKQEDILPAGSELQRESEPFVMIGRSDGSFRAVAPERTGLALSNVAFPAFVASVKQSDGRWLNVTRSEPILSGWQRNVLLALAISLLLLAPLAWVFARRLTRPFRTLADALEDGTAPTPQAGPRELREAAGAIAAMRSRLMAEATERARIMTAIAHDLRTPLTGLRLRTETVSEPQRSRMVEDIERMQTMIGEVLDFARGVAAPNERVMITPFVRQIVADMGGREEGLAMLPGDDVTMELPSLAFRRVVENLLRNAIDYGKGGAIYIKRIDDDMVLAVSDAGPGIAVEDRERLLAPFERGDGSRNRTTGGAGLGLSIVREFALQQRGSFTLRESGGGGVMAELRLPLE